MIALLTLIHRFEAAWNGDLDTIRSLTLGIWGESHDQPPLEIAVSDQRDFTCLHIAILRGHLHIAKPILQIVHAQYEGREPRARKQSEIDIDNASPDDEGLNIVSHTTDDQFSHENIGGVSTKVKSWMSPLMALEKYCDAFLFLEEAPSEMSILPTTQFETHHWNWDSRSSLEVDSLLLYAIYKNDLGLLDFLLKSGEEYVRKVSAYKSTLYVTEQAFQLAIKLGRTDCLARLIKGTAVGLPLARLSVTSGVKIEEEPFYYQGLSIRGKKRKDCASAGRNDRKVLPDGQPPLLISAMQGSLASAEWFLGTAPGRLYVEYLNSQMNVEDVRRLAQSTLGLDGSVFN